MKYCLKIIAIILIFIAGAGGTTHTVSQDGTGDFTEIQSAISASTYGDTVLVFPGTYLENIDFWGKDIVVMSTEGASQTIIDGNEQGSVVTFSDNETRDAVLSGFSLTNGTGTFDSSDMIHRGGGIYIFDASPTIHNCIIENNHIMDFGFGGGMIVKGVEVNPLLSGTTIRHNTAGFAGGGILVDGDGRITMDSLNLCNIYLNYAGAGNDFKHTSGIQIAPNTNVYLDTFTVLNPVNNYFMQLDEEDTFSIQHGYIEHVNGDLYVSPTGSNENSGLTAENPLLSINYALTLIESDSTQPNSIYLAEGNYPYSPQFQSYPLNMKSYISILGAGRDQTILDGNFRMMVIYAYEYEKHYSIKDLSIINGYNNAYSGIAFSGGLLIIENTNLLIENVTFDNNYPTAIRCISIGGESQPMPDSSSLHLKNVEIVGNYGSFAVKLYSHRWITLENCIIRENLPGDEVGTALGGGMTLGNHKLDYPYECIKTFRNTEITKNVHISDWGIQSSAIAIWGGNVNVNIINCTIADNFSYSGATITADHMGSIVNIVNSIIYGNVPQQIFLFSPGFDDPNILLLKNTLIQDAEWGITPNNGNIIHWLDGNIDNNPWFVDSDNNDYTLSSISTAINAGTDFFVWEGDTLVNLSPEDYNGSAPDLGAYEWEDSLSFDYQALPETITLTNYPNPFNPVTTISFSLTIRSNVKLDIYDILGNHIKTLLEGLVSPGQYDIEWNGDNKAGKSVVSGTYIAKLSFDNYSIMKKMTFVK